MEIIQSKNEAIDIRDWLRDKEFAEYPEGARDKTLLYCPKSLHYVFLKPGHCYLFKRSSPRYKEQFWMEIFAYRLGVQMGVPVPPTFVAYDSKIEQSGALIEWFLNTVDSSYEVYVPGGDYCQQIIPDFDRKKGKQHNFETVGQIFCDLNAKNPNDQLDWKMYWAKAFIFDALIGNTDRHQDNWGSIANPVNGIMRISPVFDNGTSLGHEISNNKFHTYEEINNLKKYISKGRHHMKWSLSDSTRTGHVELINKFATKYPETRQIMVDCLKKVNAETFKEILDCLIAFNVPVKLTAERSEFMLKLLKVRHQQLLINLDK